MREQIGGVERLAREMARRLPGIRPDRYRVLRPPASLAHRAGHLWEQAILPWRAAAADLLYSPANLAPLAGSKNVLVLHDLAALRHPEAYSSAYVRYQRRLLPAVARRATAVITVSDFSKAELIDGLGLDARAVTVIAPGVGEEFRPRAEPEQQSIRTRYDLPRPYVLTVGTLSARKNLELLAPATRALAARGIDLVLAGSDRSYLRGAPGALRRLGYVADEDLPGLYSGALALAMPSRYEGFGLPCLEAMACGTPVVATRCGALPQTVGDAGLLLDPTDGDAFAEALTSLATGAEAREKLVAAGLERAAAFSWRRTAEVTDSKIGQLLHTIAGA